MDKKRWESLVRGVDCPLDAPRPACNHPNLLVLPFSLELVRPAA